MGQSRHCHRQERSECATGFEMTGWNINLMTPGESAASRKPSMRSPASAFMEKLDIDEELADLLIEEGFPRWRKWRTCPRPRCWRSRLDEEIVNELRT